MSDHYEPHDDFPAIVIDNGSSTCRAGFAGNDAPLSVFPSIVGERKNLCGIGKSYIGDEAQDKRELLNLKYPMERGIIVNWDDMEKVWNHAFFSELKVSPEHHPVLISEPPLNPKGNREKMAQVMFETYRTPAFHIAFEALLSLFSAGHVTGTMVSVGDGVTFAVPIYDGNAPGQAIRRSDFAGRDLTIYLQDLLYKKGHCFTTSSELDIVREIKEQLCYVFNKNKERTFSEHTEDSTYKLPDGTCIKLNQERYMCPEILFKPDNIHHVGDGLAKTVFDAISCCDVHNRKELFGYIVLSGGTTFFQGFQERLQKELEAVTPTALTSVRTVAMPERKYHVWIGGSIQASLTTFHQMWITRQEYDECGPNVIHRKCS